MATFKCQICGTNYGSSLPTQTDVVGAGVSTAKFNCSVCGANSDGFLFN